MSPLPGAPDRVGPLAALVLAGGDARRLGGADKPALQVGGRALLDRVLDAVPRDAAVVVVGPARPTGRPVTWAREEPPGGGPVAGVAAGLASVDAEAVLLLAGDLPFLTPGTVDLLLDALPGADAVLLVDDAGRDQPLCAAWRTAALRAALPGDPAGAPLRVLLTGGAEGAPRVVRVAPGATPGGADASVPPPWWDCDTPDDLARAQQWAARTSEGR